MTNLKIDDRIPLDQVEVSKLSNKQSILPLPAEFGKNLTSEAKARQWLTNPHNWHESELFVLKWDGLLCTVTRREGMRLIRQHWDDGLPWAAMWTQQQRRKGNATEAAEAKEA